MTAQFTLLVFGLSMAVAGISIAAAVLVHPLAAAGLLAVLGVGVVAWVLA